MINPCVVEPVIFIFTFCSYTVKLIQLLLCDEEVLGGFFSCFFLAQLKVTRYMIFFKVVGKKSRKKTEQFSCSQTQAYKKKRALGVGSLRRDNFLES